MKIGLFRLDWAWARMDERFENDKSPQNIYSVVVGLGYLLIYGNDLSAILGIMHALEATLTWVL